MRELQSFKWMRFCHLIFTSPTSPPVRVEFNDGLNIIYGGSNAGKSYILSVLNFMLGGDKPPILKQGADYDTILLGIKFSHFRSITIHRLRKGGKITVYEDLIEDGIVGDREGTVVSADHGKGKTGSISETILDRIGISNFKVASTLAAKLLPLSLRHITPYLLIDEDRMFSVATPTQISPKNSPTLDKNVFKSLITGKDDSNITPIPDQATLKAGNIGKIELLNEMIEELNQKLSNAKLEDLQTAYEEQIQRAASLGEEFETIQKKLDSLVKVRRDTLDNQNRLEIQGSQLKAMEHRFIDLRETYITDIMRLEAIEEGGFLLRKFEDQPCPLCGAEPDHQHFNHLPADLELQQQSAQAEIKKIKGDLVNLMPTIQQLHTELTDIEELAKAASFKISEYDLQIQELRPMEANIRRAYQHCITIRDKADRMISLFERRETFLNRRHEIESLRIGKQVAEGLVIGISENEGKDFSKTIKTVLEEWGYPDVHSVEWDQQSYDFAVNGVPRGQNGKGVKAIFHSAFVVAFLIYCRDKNLPHPGFVVLDSPLVTYRKPILYKRHGELAADEAAIAQTALDLKFYEHLASLSAIGQFLVLENNDPPASVVEIARVTTFTGQKGNGRAGLFPPT